MRISGKDLLENISLPELEEMIDCNASLRGYMQGYIAEMYLKRQLLEVEGVTSVEKIPDRSVKRGDFLITYLGKEITVEAKSLSSYAIREDLLNGGWTGKISIKRTDSEIANEDGDRTSALRRGEFDILAICTFSITRTWEFQFIANKYLPSSSLYEDRLSTTMTFNTLNTPKLTGNVLKVFSDF